MKRTILKIATIILALTICLFFVSCSKDDNDKKDGTTSAKNLHDDPKMIAEEFLKSEYIEFDAKKTADLMHEGYLEFYTEYLNITKDEFIEVKQESYDKGKSNYDSKYDDWSFKYEIGELTDHDATKTQNIITGYDQECNLDIEEVTAVEYKAYVEHTENDETLYDQYNGTIVVVKIDGQWYLHDQGASAVRYNRDSPNI